MGRITMLTTNRKVGEKLYIGDTVTITVLEITPQGVRFGIEAPPTVTIYRQQNLPTDDPRREEAKAS